MTKKLVGILLEPDEIDIINSALNHEARSSFIRRAIILPWIEQFKGDNDGH